MFKGHELKVVIVGFLMSQGALANEYRYEFGGMYGERDLDVAEYTINHVYGEMYFSNKNIEGGPLAESAFLAGASSVGVYYSELDWDVEGGSDSIISTEIRGVFSDVVIVEAAYAEGRSDGEDDITTTRIGFGGYATEFDEYLISYKSVEEIDYSSISLDLHSVRILNNESAIVFDGSMDFVTQNDASGVGFSAGVSYYFDERLGVGYLYDLEKFDFGSVRSQTFSISYFINNDASLNYEYTKYSDDVEGTLSSLILSYRI